MKSGVISAAGFVVCGLMAIDQLHREHLTPFIIDAVLSAVNAGCAYHFAVYKKEPTP